MTVARSGGPGHPASCASSGFTLVELLTAIAVLAILLAIGIPSFRLYLLSSQRSAASTQLYGALAQARSEAIARNTAISVFPRSGGANLACGSSDQDWNNGWLVGASCDQDFIAVFDAVGAGVSVIPATDITQVVYRASGRTSGNVCFMIEPDSDKLQPREVSTQLSGRVSLRETDTPCTG
ncbi:MAG: GspH/FimT family pseudopilin [Gammaproteobacteria bacterium]|nr:GspH/FimT family pseudopilin [Gammaproteobacteria bacterium]